MAKGPLLKEIWVHSELVGRGNPHSGIAPHVLGHKGEHLAQSRNTRRL